MAGDRNPVLGFVPPTMKNQDWFNAVAASLVVGVVLGGLAGVAALGEGVPTANQRGTGGGPGASYRVYLTITFNPGSGRDQYVPGNFSVPSHTLLKFTIESYDNGTNPVNRTAGHVSGTVGGTATETRYGGAPTSYSDLSPDHLTHTFSVKWPEGYLNVPIGPAPSMFAPVMTTFEVYFNETGSFTWYCQAPCDMVAMVTPGFMTGTLTVD